MNPTILAELQEARKVLDSFLTDEKRLEAIENAAHLMGRSIQNGGKIISCGNGGSHCDAMHFAEELSGRFREDRGPLPGLAISDATHMSCVANDYGFEAVFSRFIESIGRAGDVLLAISTSGNSQNILNAAAAAHQQDMKVVALTGHDGGKLAQMADLEINVPHFGYSDRIQEMHIKVVHILIQLIEEVTNDKM